jgi:hypothetical protein
MVDRGEKIEDTAWAALGPTPAGTNPVGVSLLWVFDAARAALGPGQPAWRPLWPDPDFLGTCWFHSRICQRTGACLRHRSLPASEACSGRLTIGRYSHRILRSPCISCQPAHARVLCTRAPATSDRPCHSAAWSRARTCPVHPCPGHVRSFPCHSAAWSRARTCPVHPCQGPCQIVSPATVPLNPVACACMVVWPNVGG